MKAQYWGPCPYCGLTVRGEDVCPWCAAPPGFAPHSEPAPEPAPEPPMRDIPTVKPQTIPDVFGAWFRQNGFEAGAEAGYIICGCGAHVMLSHRELLASGRVVRIYPCRMCGRIHKETI